MNLNQREHEYDDLMERPRPVSTHHPHMKREDRAAQFAPFAALTGLDEEMDETARLTDARTEPDEETSAWLDQRLQFLADHLSEEPLVEITYFLPDERKSGGSYRTITAVVRYLDFCLRTVTLSDFKTIPLDDVIAVGGELFAPFDQAFSSYF